MISNLPTLQRFGGLVTVAAVSSYLAALIIVPALYAAEQAVRQRLGAPHRSLAGRSLLIAVVLIGGLFTVSRSNAGDIGALEVARHVSARPEGSATLREVAITLTNKRGRMRNRAATIVTLRTDRARFTRITYTEPKAIRDTTFLSHNFHDAEASDSRWFYLPSAHKVRRIPASDRGDYFLGTDFTYEDIQSELKFDLDDYEFESGGVVTDNGSRRYRIYGRPKTALVAKQLGYGGFEALVDAATWIPRVVDFHDLSGSPLKTVYVPEVDQIDGIWTATQISAVNHQTGHRTDFHFTDVKYLDSLEQRLFNAASLSRAMSVSISGAGR